MSYFCPNKCENDCEKYNSSIECINSCESEILPLCAYFGDNVRIRDCNCEFLTNIEESKQCEKKCKKVQDAYIYTNNIKTICKTNCERHSGSKRESCLKTCDSNIENYNNTNNCTDNNGKKGSPETCPSGKQICLTSNNHLREYVSKCDTNVCKDQKSFNRALDKAINRQYKLSGPLIVYIILHIVLAVYAIMLALKQPVENRLVHVVLAIIASPVYIIAYWVSPMKV